LEVEDITASERPSSKDEGSNNSSATKKHGLSSQESEPLLTPRKMDDDESVDKKDKTPFRITYNGEKKKYHEDEMLFDSSDDEADEARRSIKSKTSSFSANTNADAPSRLSDESVSHHGSSNNDAGNATSKSTPRNPYQKNKPQPRVTTATPSFAEKSVSAPSAPPSQFVNEPTQNRSELHRLGISHDDFKPPKYVQRPDPILHKLNEVNRPVYRRQKLSVGQIFSRPFSNIFTCKFQEFNHLQSEMSNVIANSDDNVIVSSPTGSGKTALFEMAMCRLFASNQADGKRVVSNNKKIVYIAPNKALCEERQADWSKRLVEIDPSIVCTTITGDANAAASSYGEIASANLILTTPEKWDSITRRWTEYVVLLGSVKLVLLDEVHMIGEPDRGACLESVIGRVKTIQRAATSKRFTSSEIEGSR
jgi:ATP-dependent DNA helicase HFM1/MER3